MPDAYGSGMRAYRTTPAVVYNADSRRIGELLGPKSVHAVVTDPPYELGFGGRAWDRQGVAFDPAFWAGLLEVTRPGGTLMAFGARRLWHRMACAVEDAGWELVDQIAWMFDDGMDTSETAPHALDREAGVDVKEGRVRLAGGPAGTYARRVRYRDRYQAKTDGARAWEGFSSGLRPCWEPVLVARAPRDGSFGHTLAVWGTGAFPAATDGAADMPLPARSWWYGGHAHGADRPVVDCALVRPADPGSPAWFQACDRLGLVADADTYPADVLDAAALALTRPAGRRRLAHPTVKPLALMRHLVTLACPAGGLVLDPFAGSGTTLQAALDEGRRAVGVEADPLFLPLIDRRLDTPVQTMLA